MNPDTAVDPRWRAVGRTVLAALIECGSALAGQPPFTPAPDHDEDPFDTHEGDGAA
ncbi:hypothetical protein [Amycolatopsis eburnea]|uniref:hypothetical protein n=1 Tax=Amycolatopsis eburnea TaxID=2267691 RepID=UPI0013153905|nr:hypothetical protein [Amycolatopsis eburnea]